MSVIPNFSTYFSKKVQQDMSELYQSSAVANFALSLVTIFEPIFLYTVLGYTIPQVLLFFAIVYGVYIIGIPFGGQIASKYGYRHCIALSIPFQIFFWLALLASKSHPSAALLAAAMFGIQKSFYWPGFHSVIARYAQAGQVGREFGAAYAITNLSQIGGPLLGGIVSQYAGLSATFFIAALFYCFSIIPLLSVKETFTPKNYQFSQTLEMYKNFKRQFVAYLGFGEELLVLTIWPIFIFMVVHDYKDTGLLGATASLFAAMFSLLLGQWADQHMKHKLINAGTILSSLFWLGRLICIPFNSFLPTFIMDTGSKTAKETLFIPLSTITYIKAEETHVVPYTVFFEQSLAIGKLSACLIGALLFYLTGSFVVLFILGALYSLLYRKI